MYIINFRFHKSNAALLAPLATNVGIYWLLLLLLLVVGVLL